MSAQLNRILPRPRADEEEYELMTDYEKGLLHGGVELWDKLDRLVAEGKLIISPHHDKFPDRHSF